MGFTLIFIKLFFYGLFLAAPLLLFLVIFIALLGQIVGVRESWSRYDAVYWAFITATTVGYGDFRPTGRLSKVLSVIIAITGMILTGIMVALALHAATMAFASVNDIAELKAAIQHIN